MMATTVVEAFKTFMSTRVDLDPQDTQNARASRDWLVGQLQTLHEKDTQFPAPYPDRYLGFGSFHRRTKIRPLDDIDLIACLHAQEATYIAVGSEVRITVPESASRLGALCHDGSNLLNSRKVINRFVQSLASVPQYRRADVGRDGEAAVLALTSYDWSFDVVPAFFTKPEFDGRTYYLIPDRNGHWKKTDPRIDQERITAANQGYQGALLPIIRLIKYWNRRRTMPTLQSYVLELLALAHYRDPVLAPCSKFVDLAFIPLVTALHTSIYQAVVDPAGIQAGDLNSLGWLQRYSISQRALQDFQVASAARAAEERQYYRDSLALWGQVFGPEFPTYG